MPEAAIHKNSQLIFSEGEVGLPSQCKMSTPAFDSMFVKERCKRKFGPLVPAPSNVRHDLRAFSLCENIRHGKSVIPDYLQDGKSYCLGAFPTSHCWIQMIRKKVLKGDYVGSFLTDQIGFFQGFWNYKIDSIT